MPNLKKTVKPAITIVVLGDLGRSPRMQLHALALADLAKVCLIGEAGHAPYPQVEIHSDIQQYLIRPLDRYLTMKRTGLRSALQLIWQSIALLIALLRSPKADVILMQCPPSLPAFSICRAVAKLKSSRLVLDWHNYSFSILAQRLGEDHWIVKLVKYYEKRMGPKAHTNLCVSVCMKQELQQRWGLPQVQVFHDRPGPMFFPLSPTQLAQTRALYPKYFKNSFNIICPSSWSSDDDFELLLQALPLLEQIAEQSCLNFSFLLTGDGPTKAHWSPILTGLNLNHIQVFTPWLDAADYPKLVGCAHLGLSLHRSTSKVDLPMKIVDMQGAGLVVCALDYGPCLQEQIQDGINGFLFTTPGQLAQKLLQLATPQSVELLQTMQERVIARTTVTWEQQWQQLLPQLYHAGDNAVQARL
ncbi:MAG: glycosyltransferase [Gammaproteobacteria bacterium]|nr:glycosyltransferase [Gammaproteobacteria bacterium]MDH5802587.1 glycosyltransferase [Gammaproteobacteria bacterium]